MLHYKAGIRANVSEGIIASIITAIRIVELGTALAVTSDVSVLLCWVH
jgi:hypothetical protein